MKTRLYLLAFIMLFALFAGCDDGDSTNLPDGDTDGDLDLENEDENSWISYSRQIFEVTKADLVNADRQPLTPSGVNNPYDDYRAAHGDEQATFQDLAYAFAPIPVDAKYTHVLNFLTSPFFPPWLKAIVGNGPIILYSDDMDVLVFSPVDDFFDAIMTFEDGKIQYGLNGELQQLPAELSQRFILAEGKGIAATLEYWGEQLLEDRGKSKVDRYADLGLSYLGYWTDNGAVYYYQTEGDLNYQDTLFAVQADWERENIPFRYLQLDSWWYYKEGGHGLLPGSGLIRWEPQTEMFPDGLVSFQQQLGLPLIVHNRWFAVENDYTDEYDFIAGSDSVLPANNDIYDHFMEDAISWGVTTYEQDWLINQYWRMPYMREQMGRATDWYYGLGASVAEHDLTMQICMPSTSNLMGSVDLPAVTTTRTCTDYGASFSKETYYPQFHTNNMLAWALGIWPFKDNFQSSEAFPEAEALVSALCGGMVGVGDAIGAFKRDIIMRTCREDGYLLKPDRPALPIDAMFLPHERPYTTATYSKYDGIGKWSYVAAYNLAEKHPDRTADDRMHAQFMYDGMDLNDMFVYPDLVTDWQLDLEKDLGITERRVAYDWRTATARIVNGSFEMAPDESKYGFAYTVLAPIFENGLALIGEAGKYVTMADKRFTRIAATENGLEIDLAGVANETIVLKTYDATAESMLADTQVTIGADGTATVTITR